MVRRQDVAKGLLATAVVTLAAANIPYVTRMPARRSEAIAAAKDSAELLVQEADSLERVLGASTARFIEYCGKDQLPWQQAMSNRSAAYELLGNARSSLDTLHVSQFNVYGAEDEIRVRRDEINIAFGLHETSLAALRWRYECTQ